MESELGEHLAVNGARIRFGAQIAVSSAFEQRSDRLQGQRLGEEIIHPEASAAST